MNDRRSQSVPPKCMIGLVAAGMLFSDVSAAPSAATPAGGGCDPCEGCVTEKLTESAPAGLDLFGQSVCVDGGVAVVGAYLDDVTGSDCGTAHVYCLDGETWTEEQEITALDMAADDYFGRAVAVSGTTVMVGAYGNDDAGDRSGSAYVFRRGGDVWEEEAKLTALDADAGDSFGYSVAIRGDVAIVGAPNDDTFGAFAGSAYIFRFDGSLWVEEAKLYGLPPSPAASFGLSVAAGSEVVVVGGAADVAWVYRHDSVDWSPQAILRGSDTVPGDDFGASVSVAGGPGSEFAVIGSDHDDDRGPDSGSAYVFRYESGDPGVWSEEAKLVACDGTTGDAFGRSVWITGSPGSGAILVGAPSADGTASETGAVYAFRQDGPAWVAAGELSAPDGTLGAEYGAAVSISGGTALVGARFADVEGSASGAAYASGVTALLCPGDLTADNQIDINDVFALLGAWGPCGAPCPPGCVADVTGDCLVDINDVFALLGAWGPCP